MTIRKGLLAAGLSAALLLLGRSEASAQRTAEGSVFAGASQMVTAYAVPSGGVDIGAGGYLRTSLWKAGVRVTDWNHYVSADTGVEHGCLFDHLAWSLYGGWRYRLVSTYNRVLCLYGGADAFIGLNQYEVFRPLPEELSTGLPGCEFIYGVSPELELELWTGSRVALTLGVQMPVTLGSSLKSDLWNLTGSLGVRVNINAR